MTDKVLLPAAFGGQAPKDDVAVIPGWGVIPGAEARAHIAALLDHADIDPATDPAPGPLANLARSCGCGDCSPTPLVATSSPSTPPAAASTVDCANSSSCATPRAASRGATPPPSKPTTSNAVHDGGATTGANAGGLCKRHNQVKEELGWYFTVRSTGLDGTGPHGIRIQTPTGRVHDSTAPPILGEGWLGATPDPDPPFMELDEEQERFAEEFGAWLEHAHEGHCWAA